MLSQNLEKYCENRFMEGAKALPSLPLEDEKHIAAWSDYLATSRENGRLKHSKVQ